MAEISSIPLLALIQEQGLVDDLQLEEVVQEHTRSGKPVIQLLQDFGLLDLETILQIMAGHLGTEVVELRELEFTPEILQTVPATAARMHQCLPVAVHGSTVRVALSDPLNPAAIDELGYLTGKEVQVVVADPAQIEKAINKHYGEESESVSDILKELGADADIAKEVAEATSSDGAADLENLANEAPIIKFVNLVLYQAVQDRASDIHFEPFEDEFKIRYRVDGALYEMTPPPKHLALPVTSRIKVMANLDIAERRLPQDGRIGLTLSGRQIDLRVSTLPTQFGKSWVLRVLDRAAVNMELESLGFPEFVLNYVRETILQPNGIFIVTGPTCCGKTTTLYSCLRRINSIDSKLLTAEEPVEYDLEGIVQVPVNEAIGLTFARVLRSFLRQDPDRIMIGETRDLETAQIAIQASLTGHLVFTTLHTNDAPGAITPQIDIGVEPFLISSTLEAVLGQRLLRSICRQCRTTYTPGETLLAELGISRQDIGNKQFFYGKGCEACNNTGDKGRKGIYELLRLTDPIRELINERAPTVTLKQKAVELGMITLRQDGLRSVFAGDTTVEEVLRYT